MHSPDFTNNETRALRRIFREVDVSRTGHIRYTQLLLCITRSFEIVGSRSCFDKTMLNKALFACNAGGNELNTVKKNAIFDEEAYMQVIHFINFPDQKHHIRVQTIVSDDERADQDGFAGHRSTISSASQLLQRSPNNAIELENIPMVTSRNALADTSSSLHSSSALYQRHHSSVEQTEQGRNLNKLARDSITSLSHLPTTSDDFALSNSPHTQHVSTPHKSTGQKQRVQTMGAIRAKSVTIIEQKDCTCELQSTTCICNPQTEHQSSIQPKDYSNKGQTRRIRVANESSGRLRSYSDLPPYTPPADTAINAFNEKIGLLSPTHKSASLDNTNIDQDNSSTNHLVDNNERPIQRHNAGNYSQSTSKHRASIAANHDSTTGSSPSSHRRHLHHPKPTSPLSAIVPSAPPNPNDPQTYSTMNDSTQSIRSHPNIEKQPNHIATSINTLPPDLSFTVYTSDQVLYHPSDGPNEWQISQFNSTNEYTNNADNSNSNNTTDNLKARTSPSANDKPRKLRRKSQQVDQLSIQQTVQIASPSFTPQLFISSTSSSHSPSSLSLLPLLSSPQSSTPTVPSLMKLAPSTTESTLVRQSPHPPPISHRPIFTLFISCLQVILLSCAIYINKGFSSFSNNMSIGPSQRVQLHMGAMWIPCVRSLTNDTTTTTKAISWFFPQGAFVDDAYPILKKVEKWNMAKLKSMCGMGGFGGSLHANQSWRYLTVLGMPSGALTLILYLLVINTVGRKIEKQIGSWRVGIAYLLSGVGGTAWGVLMGPDRVINGPTGSIYGLLGLMLANLVMSFLRNKTPKRWKPLMYGGCLTIAALLAGLLPTANSWVQIGGVCVGIVVGFQCEAKIPIIRRIGCTLCVITVAWMCICVQRMTMSLRSQMCPVLCPVTECMPSGSEWCQNELS